MGKQALIALVGLLVSGCAIVTSETALFEAADSAGAPTIRPGVWTLAPADCAFDPRFPIAAWPSCANATVVTATTIGNGHEKTPEDHVIYLVAAGDPLVVQMQAPKNHDKNDPNYVYAGLRPTERDREGRVTRARAWLGLCNKPPPLRRAAEVKPGPLQPGLKPGKAELYCEAPDQQTARAAVLGSEAWAFTGEPSELGVTARWVRDGAE